MRTEERIRLENKKADLAMKLGRFSKFETDNRLALAILNERAWQLTCDESVTVKVMKLSLIERAKRFFDDKNLTDSQKKAVIELLA